AQGTRRHSRSRGDCRELLAPPLPAAQRLDARARSPSLDRELVEGPRLARPPSAATLGTAMSDDPAKRPKLYLQPGRHKRAVSGHPWIYYNEVTMDAAAKALPAGGLVSLRNAGGDPLGVATFNPHTLVSARLLDRDAQRRI